MPLIFSVPTKNFNEHIQCIRYQNIKADDVYLWSRQQMHQENRLDRREASHFPQIRAAAHLLSIIRPRLTRPAGFEIANQVNYARSTEALLNVDARPLAILDGAKGKVQKKVWFLNRLVTFVFSHHVRSRRLRPRKPRKPCTLACILVLCINDGLWQKQFSCRSKTLIFSPDPGADGKGVIQNFNKTVLHSLPRSLLLIEVESVLMGAAFLAMIIVRPPSFQ